jgi:hypothetical protein
MDDGWDGSNAREVRGHEQEVAVEGRDMDEQWSDWAKLLSAKYVEYVQNMEFEFFVCPTCHGSI